MHLFSLLCFAGALLAMLFAIIYQRRDIVPNYGGTMGGEMTTGFVWVIASLLSAAGSVALIPWYFSMLVFFLVFALSFLVRILVAWIPKPAK